MHVHALLRVMGRAQKLSRRDLLDNFAVCFIFFLSVFRIFFLFSDSWVFLLGFRRHPVSLAFKDNVGDDGDR